MSERRPDLHRILVAACLMTATLAFAQDPPSTVTTEPPPAEPTPAPVVEEREAVKVSPSRRSQMESSSVQAGEESRPEPPEELDRGEVAPQPTELWQPTDEADQPPPPPTLSSLSEGRPDPSRELTLLELVDVALARNPNTRQAWHNARSAAAQERVTHAAYYPTITLSVQGGPAHSTSPAFPGESQNDQWSGGPQLGVTYLLLDFGGRDAAAESARQTLLASNFVFNGRVQDVILGVTQAYYNLDTKRALLDNTAVNLKLATNTLESVGRKKKAGLASETDVLQAAQAKAQAAADFETAIGNLTSSQASLAQSLSLPANVTVHVIPPEGPVNLGVLGRQVNQLVDEALTQRPDIAAASATLLAKRAAARQADAAVWPTLTSTFNLQRTLYKANFTSPRANSNVSGHFDNSAAYVTLSVDLFDGLSKVNKARAARSDADAALAGLAATELNAVSDVVTTYIAFRNANQRVAATQALITASQKSLDSVQASYKAGLKNIIDLLTAQNNLASARAQNIQARNDLFLNSAQLSRSTGTLLPPASAPVKADPKPPEE